LYIREQAEFLFSKMKLWMRRNRKKYRDLLPVEFIMKALHTITPQDFVNWIKNCGDFYMQQ
jgi:hypothetical protein